MGFSHRVVLIILLFCSDIILAFQSGRGSSILYFKVILFRQLGEWFTRSLCLSAREYKRYCFHTGSYRLYIDFITIKTVVYNCDWCLYFSDNIMKILSSGIFVWKHLTGVLMAIF